MCFSAGGYSHDRILYSCSAGGCSNGSVRYFCSADGYSPDNMFVKQANIPMTIICVLVL